jgi:integrase
MTGGWIPNGKACRLVKIWEKDNVFTAQFLMGHRNTEMIIKVYTRYVENRNGSPDGSRLDKAFRELKVRLSNDG